MYTIVTSPEAATAPPHSISHTQHIPLTSTKHSTCSSWVRWCVLQCLSLSSSGVVSTILLPKHIDIDCLQLIGLSACTHIASLLMTPPGTTQAPIPEASANTSASAVQFSICQTNHSTNLLHVCSTTPPPTTTSPHASARPHMHHQLLLELRLPPSPRKHEKSNQAPPVMIVCLHYFVNSLIRRNAFRLRTPEAGTTYHALAKPQPIPNC